MRLLSETERDGEAFRALVGSLDDLVFVWKTSGEMLFVNDAFVRVTGLTTEDFGFQNRDNPFIHPDDLPHVLAELAAFTESSALRAPPLTNRFIDAWGKVHTLVSIAHRPAVARFHDRGLRVQEGRLVPGPLPA